MSTTSKHLFLASAILLATLLVSVTSKDDNFFIHSYMLSLQWPPSYCSVNECNSGTIKNLWVIHGLWPQDANGRGIPPYDSKTNKCVGDVTPYNSAVELVIYELKSKLEQYWPSLKKGSKDYKFWQHEWEAHGKCSDYPTDPKAYFKAAYDLRINNDPIKVLGVPAGGRATLETILANIQTKIGKNPQIFCLKDTSARIVLVEVRFCLARAADKDKPPSSFVDCPRTSTNCPTSGDIVLPMAAYRNVPDEVDIIREVVSV